MLLLGSDAILVEGVMVYPDHADANQFWYLPAPVTLETTGEGDDKRQQFSLIKYQPDVVAQGKGGGFLMFTTALALSPEQEARILARVSALATDPSAARVTAVSYDDGTVQCIALGLQGSSDTAAPASQPGTVTITEKILGAVTPSLFGDDNASFSLSLSEEGATLVERSFEDGMTPIGVLYDLKFTAVRPALDVKITADLKKVYEGFSAGLAGEAYYVTASIDAAFEKLKQDGVISIQVINLTTDEENKRKEDLALDLFKQQLVGDWFKPSLADGKAEVDVGAATDADAKRMVDENIAASAAARSQSAAMSNQNAAAGGGSPAQAATRAVQSAAPAAATSDQTATVTVQSAASAESQKEAATSVALVATASLWPPRGKDAASGGGSPIQNGGVVFQNSLPGSPTAAQNAAVGGQSSPPGSSTPNQTTAAGGQSSAPGAPAPVQAPAAGPTAAKGVTALGGAGAAASPFGVALRLKYVQQEELKTLTIEYTRQDAVQHVYAPQGYFGLMLNSADKSKYIAEIDLADQFFTRLDVNLTPPKDFDSIGLLSAHVCLDYGDPNTPDSKHGEYAFDHQNHATTKWSIYRNAARDTKYSYAVDYHFDPQSDWEGEKLSYQLPAVTTENQELFITPYEVLGFQQIHIRPCRINWTLVDSIEVNGHYQARSGWVSEKQFVLRSDTGEQEWKLRLADKDDSAYTFQLKHRLKDGTTIEGVPVTAKGSTILVDDPFDGAINVQVVPSLDAGKTRQAVVDIRYDDPDRGYSYTDSITLQPAQSTAVKMRIPIIDASRRSWNYRVSIIGPGEQVNRGAFIDTTETLILVTDAGGQ